MIAMETVTVPSGPEEARLARRLAECGIRVTGQRLRIARLLLQAPQHLTAEQIAEALRRDGERVAKATVYNTLNLFAGNGQCFFVFLFADKPCKLFRTGNICPFANIDEIIFFFDFQYFQT